MCLSPSPGFILVQSQADHRLCHCLFLSFKSICWTCWYFCTFTSVLGKPGKTTPLCCQPPEHATAVTLKYLPAAMNFLLGDRANFAQTCSLSRMSNKFFQSGSTTSLTEAVYYTALCASILASCSCHGLFGLQVAVHGLKCFLLPFFIIQLNDFQRG